jgi:hypothetical protein
MTNTTKTPLLEPPPICSKYRFLQTLNDIDFGSIAYKLINPEEGEGWSLEETTEAIEQYRFFLILNYLYPEGSIVPSRKIDKVWHAHVLDTIAYRRDCDMLFGYFLDHFPYFGMNDAADREALEKAFDRTKQLWQNHFDSEMTG